MKYSTLAVLLVSFCCGLVIFQLPLFFPLAFIINFFYFSCSWLILVISFICGIVWGQIFFSPFGLTTISGTVVSKYENAVIIRKLASLETFKLYGKNNLQIGQFVKLICFQRYNKGKIIKILRQGKQNGILMENKRIFLNFSPYEKFYKAIIFGESYNNEIFRNNNTSHILAISGLHMGVIMGSIRLIFSRLTRLSIKVNYWICANIGLETFVFIPSLVGGIFYWWISGGSASCTRALIMQTMIFSFPFNYLKILIITCFLMLLLNPSYIYDPSFQMSFISTFALLWSKSATFIGIFNIAFSKVWNVGSILVNFITVFLMKYLLPLVFLAVLLESKFILFISDFITKLIFLVHNFYFPLINTQIDQFLQLIYIYIISFSFVSLKWEPMILGLFFILTTIFVQNIW